MEAVHFSIQGDAYFSRFTAIDVSFRSAFVNTTLRIHAMCQRALTPKCVPYQRTSVELEFSFKLQEDSKVQSRGLFVGKPNLSPSVRVWCGFLVLFAALLPTDPSCPCIDSKEDRRVVRISPPNLDWIRKRLGRDHGQLRVHAPDRRGKKRHRGCATKRSIP
jgi:hypothetical protein